MRQGDRNLVDFIIAGSAKSGTTALYSILDQHPDIFMSVIKETNYFFQAYTENHAQLLRQNGRPRIEGWGDESVIIEKPEQYDNLFADAANNQLVGEASPLYMLASSLPEKIKAYNPDIKIVIMLRNPTDVAWANFVMQCRDGVETIDVEDIDGFLNQARYENPMLHPFCDHLDMPKYAKHLPAYVEAFGHNLHLMIFEDFLADKDGELKKLFDFLGVKPEDNLDTESEVNVSAMPKHVWIRDLLRHNLMVKKVARAFMSQDMRNKVRNFIETRNAGKKVKMPDYVRAHLDKMYKDDRNYVENSLGLDISAWHSRLTGQAASQKQARA